jgi:hypothetical protein
MDGKKHLNLDDLFGHNQDVTVTWGGREYVLHGFQSIGPREFAHFDQVQKRAIGLKSTASMTEEQAEELGRLTDECLKIVGPDLPLDQMPFMAKVQTLQFYSEQLEGEAKKSPKAAPPRRGRKR